ncbi:hypothetical protein AB4142_26660 [Variovorax sp. 2RAF20]
MAAFPEDLYLPGPGEPAGVLAWGKSPEQTEKDLAAAVARIGGWRRPDYGQAYLLGANTLLRKAREDGHLDHHALPIFYLQRHSTELLIKEALQFAVQIHDLCKEVGKPAPTYPSDEQRSRVGRAHELKPLLADLEDMVLALKVGEVPGSLRLAVEAITSIEDDPTWARYSFRRGKRKGDGSIHHAVEEVVVPLGDIQNLLQRANHELGVAWAGPSLVIGNLGQLWQDLMRRAGHID